VSSHEHDRTTTISQVIPLAAGSTEITVGFAECRALPAEAIHAMSQGWLLFPVVGRANSRCSEIVRASHDVAQMKRWTEDFPGCRWAVMLGPQSGVFVIEADPECCLLSELEWPDTLCSRTDTGHILSFWRYPGGMTARSRGSVYLAPGLILRAEGESVAIPSIPQQAWPPPDCSVVAAPYWIVEKGFREAEVSGTRTFQSSLRPRDLTPKLYRGGWKLWSR
jgi:hypothetical protein